MFQYKTNRRLYWLVIIEVVLAALICFITYLSAKEFFFNVLTISLISVNITAIIVLFMHMKSSKSNDEVLNKMISDLSVEKSRILNLLNLLTDGLIVFDSDGKSILVNKRALDFTDYDDDNMDFLSFSEIFNIDITLEELLYVESSTNRIRTVIKKDKYYKIEFVSSFEGEPRAHNVIVVIKDCTEQWKLDEMRKDFIANVSHELKTPLTSIASYTEALMDGAIADMELANSFLSVVASEANRMERLIRDLLHLSQIDRGSFPLKKRRLSFESLVKSCVDKIKIDAENNGLIVESYVIGDIPEIYMDGDRIEQVLLNVLSNAIKYTPEKGKISVYIGRSFSQVYVKISDTGIGIPKESLDRVFERFYRIDKARTREQGGSGLGLAISKEIVEAHGGEIAISSEFGVGTEVTVRLPVNTKSGTSYKNRPV